MFDNSASFRPGAISAPVISFEERSGTDANVPYSITGGACTITDCHCRSIREINAALLAALEAALDCYNNMTSDDYSTGHDRPIRERMEAAITAVRGEDA